MRKYKSSTEAWEITWRFKILVKRPGIPSVRKWQLSKHLKKTRTQAMKVGMGCTLQAATQAWCRSMSHRANQEEPGSTEHWVRRWVLDVVKEEETCMGGAAPVVLASSCWGSFSIPHFFRPAAERHICLTIFSHNCTNHWYLSFYFRNLIRRL